MITSARLISMCRSVHKLILGKCVGAAPEDESFKIPKTLTLMGFGVLTHTRMPLCVWANEYFRLVCFVTILVEWFWWEKFSISGVHLYPKI